VDSSIPRREVKKVDELNLHAKGPEWDPLMAHRLHLRSCSLVLSRRSEVKLGPAGSRYLIAISSVLECPPRKQPSGGRHDHTASVHDRPKRSGSGGVERPEQMRQKLGERWSCQPLVTPESTKRREEATSRGNVEA